MPRVRLVGPLLAAALVLAGCGGAGDGERVDTEPTPVEVGPLTLGHAVDATLDAKTATYVIRNGWRAAMDFGIDGVYDLAAGSNHVVARSVYQDSRDREVHRIFERTVVGDQIFLREADVQVGVEDDLDRPWRNVTRRFDRSAEAARGPEVVRLLKGLRPVDDGPIDDGMVSAVVPASRLLAVMVPDLLRATKVEGDRTVEVEVSVLGGTITSIQFEGGDVAKRLGKKQISALITDDFSYDPSGMGTVTVRLSGLGDKVTITDPMGQRS